MAQVVEDVDAKRLGGEIMMRMLGSLLSVSLFLCVAPPTEAQPDPRASAAFRRLDPWLRSIVYIRVECGAQNTYFGTGVLVRDTGEVLTAAHVGQTCPDVRTARMGRLRSLYTAPGSELTATLQHRIADSRTSPTQDQIGDTDFQDLALWKIDDMKNSGLIPARLATSFPMPGEPIEIAGFSADPFSHPIVGDAGRNSGPGLTRFRTHLISVGASASDVPYRLHYSGSTLGGTSGGPVFNAAGELIGIHSGRESRYVSDLVQIDCKIENSSGNCAQLTLPGPNNTQIQRTIGINIREMKDILDNYSWGTSIFAVPSTWLPASRRR